MSSMVTPTAVLRPTLEAAVQVARAGEAAEPPHSAPPALRRFLRFARLPAPALDVARRVIEEDDEFRARVASHLSESDVGRAGWLWLTRPEGWEDQFDALRRKQAEAEHQEREERAERDAQRKLSFAEDRARRAEALLALRAAELDSTRAELAAAQSRLRQLGGELEALAAQVSELRDQRGMAVRKLKEVEGELSRRNADLRQARHEIRMRDAELAERRGAPVQAQGHAAAPASAPESRSSAPEPRLERAAPNEPLDRARLAEAVGRAAIAAKELSASLSATSALLELPSQRDALDPRKALRIEDVLPRRRPAALPPGVLDDSSAAADHLLRLPEVLVLVDGYNVTKLAWPNLPISAQRVRLVDALSELHARCAAQIEVVFDGADADGSLATGTRSAVRIRFSPGGVEADDVLLELLERTRRDRPVVVVSSDNRVREGARTHGANVMGARQLLMAMGR